MGGHTQEPWMLGARYPESHWIDVVSQTDERGLPFVSCKHHDEEANARRIVASVNATAGISVGALEAGYIAELVGALQQAEDALDGVPAGDLSAKIDRRIDKALKRVTATLAKVKGEAA